MSRTTLSYTILTENNVQEPAIDHQRRRQQWYEHSGAQGFKPWGIGQH